MNISHSPYLFFFINSIIVFIIGILLWNLLEKIHTKYKLLIFIICFFNIGFVTINIGICYPERPLILFIMIFIICSYYAQFDNKYAMILGIVSANIAIYLKEPTFIIIASFGLIHIIYNFYKKCYSLLFITYCTILIISSIVFISIYIFYVSPKISISYNENAFSKIILSHQEYILFLARGLFNFTIENPFLMILLPFILFTKIIFFKRFVFNSFLDSLLIGGFLYLLTYIKLQIFTNYYLTPVYFITAFSIGYYVSKYKIYKYIALFCIIIHITNALPQSIYTFLNLKKDGIAFEQSLEFINQYTKRTNNKINIYFDGIGRGEQYNDYYIAYFILYLNDIYNIYNFDIKTKDNNSPNLTTKPMYSSYRADSPYTIYNSTKIDSPKSGDLIILNSFTNKYINKDYINNMNNNYKLIYKTNLISLPQITLKTIIKYFTRDTQLNYINNNNIYKLPINTYIYLVE